MARKWKGAGGAWRWGRRVVVAAALLLAGAGCSGGREHPAGEPPAPPGEVRREFVVLRELVKQHAAQEEAGNEARVEAVERYLRDWLARVPDEGANEEEREVLRLARELDKGE